MVHPDWAWVKNSIPDSHVKYLFGSMPSIKETGKSTDGYSDIIRMKSTEDSPVQVLDSMWERESE